MSWDDFDALAIEAEDGDPYRFTWNGTKFEMPTLQQIGWVDCVFILEENPVGEKLRRILGDQYDAFVAKQMSKARVDALLERWFAHQGIDLGESGASASS